MKMVIVAAAFMAALTGCGAMENVRADQAAKMAEFERTVPVCAGEEECKVAWATARNWVITNCGRKIQNISDGYIETYGSTDTSLACRVMGEPQPDGSWRMVIRTGCGNMFGCVPDSWASAFAFNGAINAAIEGRRPQLGPVLPLR